MGYLGGGEAGEARGEMLLACWNLVEGRGGIVPVFEGSPIVLAAREIDVCEEKLVGGRTIIEKITKAIIVNYQTAIILLCDWALVGLRKTGLYPAE